MHAGGGDRQIFVPNGQSQVFMLILDNVSKLETDFIDVPVQSLLISPPQLFSYLAGVMAGLLL